MTMPTHAASKLKKMVTSFMPNGHGMLGAGLMPVLADSRLQQSQSSAENPASADVNRAVGFYKKTAENIQDVIRETLQSARDVAGVAQKAMSAYSANSTADLERELNTTSYLEEEPTGNIAPAVIAKKTEGEGNQPARNDNTAPVDNSPESADYMNMLAAAMP